MSLQSCKQPEDEVERKYMGGASGCLLWLFFKARRWLFGLSFYYCMVEAFSTFLELSGCWIRMKKLVDQERELKELNGFLLSFEKEMELDGN